MKKHYLLFLSAMLIHLGCMAQGWPSKYGGVMLQGFYWDSFDESSWRHLESKSEDISRYFSLVWVPQSGKAQNGTSMGYDPLYYYNQNSSFGNEAELRSMIAAFKSHGTGVIADVVVNHRGNVSTWFDFPEEVNPLDGNTYQMLSTDICKNDDGGATLAEAQKQGVSLSDNNDEGEGWGGMRDLDHKSPNVQENVKAYLKYLLEYLGYTGFRYDMVKGFSASHIHDYNTSVGVEYSVGECWDSNATIERWVKDAEYASAAFDFQFRYNVRDAVNSDNCWNKLESQNNMNHDAAYRRYAITFVENHDTQYRSADAQQDPIRRDTLAANAWLLANPGTPCIFYSHWLDCKKAIKQMIEARRLCGINNESDYENLVTGYSTRIVRRVKGSKGDLIVACGTTIDKFNVPEGFKEILSGKNFKYFTNADTGSWQTTLDRIDAEQEAEDNEEETFDTPTAGYTFNAYFLAPASWHKTIKAWVWNKNRNDENYTGGAWPGERCYKIGKSADGRYIWQWCYYGSLSEVPTNIIFNNSGSPQTKDLNFTDGGWYDDSSVNSNPTLDIQECPEPDAYGNETLYNLAGQKVDESYKGIVIRNGKKFFKE